MTEIPTPLALGLVGLVSTIAGALIAAFSKKWRTPADDREDRKVGIEADEKLIQRFEQLMNGQDKKIADLGSELKEVRAIAEKAVHINRVLTDWIYAAVRVVRELGGIHLLPAPPDGVVIADHPSNKTTPKEEPHE
jgi:hypothetical protein